MICLRQLALIVDLVRITLHQLLIRPDALSGPAVQYAAPCIQIEEAFYLLVVSHSLLRRPGRPVIFPLLHQPLDLIEHAQRKFVIRREFQLDAIFRLVLFLQQPLIGRPDFLELFRIFFRGMLPYQFEVCPFDRFLVRIFTDAEYLIVFSHPCSSMHIDDC